jgi:putative serine protease PepD
VADEIIATGKVTHAFIGVQTEPLSATATGVSGQSQGLFVSSVVSGSPAATAGLRVGNVITSIDGDAAVSNDQLIAVTLSKRAGDQVKIGYADLALHPELSRFDVG